MKACGNGMNPALVWAVIVSAIVILIIYAMVFALLDPADQVHRIGPAAAGHCA